MNREQNIEAQPAERTPPPSQRRTLGAGWYRPVAWLFAHEAVSERVATRFHFDGSPEAVWNRIMLYEDVPRRPPLLLRTLLPNPIRTEGDKARVGATVRCMYRGGDLTKRITAVELPHLLEFEVVEQNLGIEGCMLSLGGSYRISSRGNATDVVLITHYEAYLRPRFLWRPLEAHLAHALHKHIFSGICAVTLPGLSAKGPLVAETFTAQNSAHKDIPHTASQPCSRQ